MKTKSKTDDDKKSGITEVRKVSQVGKVPVCDVVCDGNGLWNRSVFQRGVAAEEVMDGGSGDIYLFIQFIRPQHEIV